MKKFIRKNTAWNFFASLFVILYMIGTVGNAILVKFNLLTQYTQGKLFIRSWVVDLGITNLNNFDFAKIVQYLPTIGIALGAFLLLLLPICFAKHGKCWNLIPLLLILADTVWYGYNAITEGVFGSADNIITYVKDVFSAPFVRFLTPADINLMAHVLIVLFIAFGAAKGTKRIPIVDPASAAPVYRTITVVRKAAPFARTTALDCWFNGEMLSEIADGEEKSFLVDQYGAEFVVVAPSGEESEIINIAEGEENKKYVVSTSRDGSGVLHISVAEA